MTWLSGFIRHGRGYCTAALDGLPEEKLPRTVLTSWTTAPSSESTAPAPIAEPAGAPAGTASLILAGGVPSGAVVMLVTVLAPLRYRSASGPRPPITE